MYTIGTWLKHKQNGQLFRITHIDSRSNARCGWKLYTLERVDGKDRYCLRIGKLKRSFIPDKVAQTLYGLNSEEIARRTKYETRKTKLDKLYDFAMYFSDDPAKLHDSLSNNKSGGD